MQQLRSAKPGLDEERADDCTRYGCDRMKSKARHVSTRDREARAINSVLRVIINVDESRERETAATIPERKSQGARDARAAASPRRSSSSFSFFFFFFLRLPSLWRISLSRPPLLSAPRCYRLLTSETVSSKPRWDVPSAN